MRRDGGFSLIELMIATMIVAVVLIGTVAAILSGAKLAEDTARMHAVSRSIDSVVEEIRSIDPSELETRYQKQRLDLGDYGVDGLTAWADVTVTRVQEATEAHPLYELVISATYEGASEDSRITVTTQITDRVQGTSLGGQEGHSAQ